VAVVSNGTAVLGLGDIGALGGSRHGRQGRLFKRFAGVDVFDIEVNTHDPDEIIKLVKLLEPPSAHQPRGHQGARVLHIEEELKEDHGHPVFMTTSTARPSSRAQRWSSPRALVNKKIGEVRVVFAGAGAAGIACANMYLNLGVRRENIHFGRYRRRDLEGRTEKMNPYKERFAVETKERTLADAMKGADVFVGVSARTSSRRDAEVDGGEPDRVRDGETPIRRSRTSWPWRRARRHHGDRRSDYPNQVKTSSVSRSSSAGRSTSGRWPSTTR